MATPSAETSAAAKATKSARDIYLRRLKSDVDAACEALGSAEVLEVLEGLRVLKAASLDATCRELVIRSGGFAAVITCFINIKPSPNNWLLLEVLETAATTLLLLLCGTRKNTSVCQTRRYSSWWKKQRAKELKHASPASNTIATIASSSSSSSVPLTPTAAATTNDPCWYNEYAGRILHKACGGRLLMSVLKAYPNRERLVHALSWLLLVVGEIEGKTGQLARTDGGISLILDVLWTPVTMADGSQVSRSPLSLQAVLLLLCLFTRTSESNVFAVSKAGGFSVLCKFAAQWRTMPLVSEAAFTVLANCSRLDKISAVCPRVCSVVKVAFEALQMNTSTEDTSAGAVASLQGKKKPRQNSRGVKFETTEVVLQLVSNLSSVASNVATMLSNRGKEQMHELLKMSSLPLHLRIICCTIMWKLLAHSSNKSKNAKHFDLNRTQKWDKSEAKRAFSTGGTISAVNTGMVEETLSVRLLEGLHGISPDGNASAAEADESVVGGGRISSASAYPRSVPSLAEQCGCTEGQFEHARRFPELLGMGNQKHVSGCKGSKEKTDFGRESCRVGASESASTVITDVASATAGKGSVRKASIDDDELSGSADGLSGWGTHTTPSPRPPKPPSIQHGTPNRPSSREARHLARIRRTLRHELLQALESETAITRFPSTVLPAFAVPHSLLPTASGPLGHAPVEHALLKASPTENDFPLRLNRNACQDLLQAQLECIDRIMQVTNIANAAVDMSSQPTRGKAVVAAAAMEEATRPIYDADETKCPEQLPNVPSLHNLPMSPTIGGSREILYARQQARERDQLRLQAMVDKSNTTAPSASQLGTAWATPPLLFESRFESGNLSQAIRMGDCEYNMICANDVNTEYHTQWFFFSVYGMRKGCRYRFNLINLEKPSSQYNNGMQPVVYSELAAERDGKSWFRRGENVCYYQNLYRKTKNGKKGTACFTVTWTDVHDRNDDRVYYAYCLPYTQTDMRNKVRSLQQFEVPVLSPSYIGKPPFSSSNSDAGDFVDSDDDLPPPLVESNAPAPSSPERAPLCGETPPKLSLITSQNDLPADRKASSPFSTNRTHDVCGESGHSKAASAAAAVANSTVPTGGSETHGHSGLMIRTLLCYSMSGNPVPLLTITDFSAPQNEIAKRKYVVLSARVHPGESPASYMIDGVIDFLCGQTAAARTLRKLAVFKIVPMLNPDGVAAGNHRCNLAGHDLNRRWNAPSKELAPTIYHLKEMIRNLVEMHSAQQVDEESNRSRTSRENMDILHAPSPGGCSVKATLSKSSHIRKGQGVALFCDFHAHSGKKNIFIYGCENSKGAPERLFPLALSKMSETFSFQDCSFKVQKKKSNCGRIVVHKELGVVNSYTIETSFCGLDIGTRSGLHLRGHDWKTIGESFCRTLLELLLPDSEIIKSAEAQLLHLAPDKFRGYGSSVGSARQEGDVDWGAVSDGSVPSKNERSGGTGSRSSKGKRHGSSTPKRVKSRRSSGNSSTDEAITKSSSGRARTSSGRNRLRKKSSSGKNK